MRRDFAGLEVRPALRAASRRSRRVPPPGAEAAPFSCRDCAEPSSAGPEYVSSGVDSSSPLARSSPCAA
ncbi:Uncharacterised protein [Mycobacteroides abscessus subsp. abscessus]|nr:Uncharacterised protein [Mycobacteroides abscessus subsp. abscessus]